MKNVLICALAGDRRAIELRWVREIATLGPITAVPGAPAAVAGVTSFKGAIVPVMNGAVWLGADRPGRGPRAGDPLVLLDVDGARAAMAVERIDAVTTLGDDLLDAEGRPVALLDPPALLALARRLIGEAAAALPTLLAGAG